MKYLLSFVIIFTGFLTVHTQTNGTGSELVLTPSEHITALAEGTLLIRLPTNRKKIQALEEALDGPDLSDKSSERLRMMLDDAKVEAKEEQQAFVDAFVKEYGFSAYAFFFDHDTPAVLEGWATLYTSDLKTETTIDTDKPWYILSIGRTPDSRLDGLVILDHKLDVVPKPFPNNVITSGFAALRAWFSGEPPKHAHVRKLQKNLDRFMEKLRASSF